MEERANGKALHQARRHYLTTRLPKWLFLTTCVGEITKPRLQFALLPPRCNPHGLNELWSEEFPSRNNFPNEDMAVGN
jgi:hypothetical protein